MPRDSGNPSQLMICILLASKTNSFTQSRWPSLLWFSSPTLKFKLNFYSLNSVTEFLFVFCVFGLLRSSSKALPQKKFFSFKGFSSKSDAQIRVAGQFGWQSWPCDSSITGTKSFKSFCFLASSAFSDASKSTGPFACSEGMPQIGIHRRLIFCALTYSTFTCV